MPVKYGSQGAAVSRVCLYGAYECVSVVILSCYLLRIKEVSQENKVPQQNQGRRK